MTDEDLTQHYAWLLEQELPAFYHHRRADGSYSYYGINGAHRDLVRFACGALLANGCDPHMPLHCHPRFPAKTIVEGWNLGEEDWNL